MKKHYEKPCLEVTEFRFSEHIAASGDAVPNCTIIWLNSGPTGCTSGTPVEYSVNN
ncbi:MAG TPA: hypothetical protein PK629_09765 [Oscillospiraceae bacterium]|nr:hypothetical protein [Oscillospiraceae bacterium]HPF54948.1 hypothetical protein [Clostridiales bacterium]HPK35007.1 hypothetical protein [Oscillospiraceae bacterium]HPR75565.1 hypothetical protein [Oscillospiraceae bacterium]